MSATNLEIVTFAFLKCNVIDEGSSPSPEQGVVGLTTLNDMLADYAADGIHLGWYPQTNLAVTSPLQSKDVDAVKLGLTAKIAAHYGIDLAPLLLAQITEAKTRLFKRALRQGLADLSDLPRPQGIFTGGWY
jgi:hypothetical protein